MKFLMLIYKKKDLKKINKNLFLCPGRINQLYFLNSENKSIQFIIKFNNSINETLIINKNFLFVCEANLLKLIKIEKQNENFIWKTIFNKQLHREKISCLLYENNKLISCSFNGEIKIWKIKLIN